jgi:membrane protease YdiL (CAAX protease family)
MERVGWPRWAAITAASLGIFGLAAFYVAALRYTVDVSQPGNGYTADERDGIYLAIHGVALLAAVALGAGLGRFARRQAFGWASLYAVVIVVVMAGTLVGSRELACAHGENDLVRHWECSGQAVED